MPTQPDDAPPPRYYFPDEEPEPDDFYEYEPAEHANPCAFDDPDELAEDLIFYTHRPAAGRWARRKKR